MTVNHRGAARLRSGHPWVYRSDLAGTPEAPAGSLVHVRDERGRKLGSALYSSASQIAIRLLTSGELDEPHWLILLLDRIGKAIRFRQAVPGKQVSLGLKPARDDNHECRHDAVDAALHTVDTTDSYRVVFSEADLLPGLMVDRYNDVLAMQVLTQAFDREDLRQVVIDSLTEHFPGASLVERVDPHIRELEQLPPRESQLVVGERSKTVFTLNGVRFHFDGLGGQKTGAFLDQRENYAAAVRHAHGQALDCFTYQGGFALHLARVCESVTAVDASRPALEVGEQNEQLNRAHHRCGEIEWMDGNAFDILKDYEAAGRQYDTIVLDPPAFAKTKRAVPAALRGYKELNLRALKMLRPGGLLVTCSCSFHVGEADFLETLGAAAADANRRVRILERRGASADHPALLNVPETSYLKCVLAAILG